MLWIKERSAKVLCACPFNISLSSGFCPATPIPWTSCYGKAVVGNNLIVNGVLLLVKLLLLKMPGGLDSVRSPALEINWLQSKFEAAKENLAWLQRYQREIPPNTIVTIVCTWLELLREAERGRNCCVYVLAALQS